MLFVLVLVLVLFFVFGFVGLFFLVFGFGWAREAAACPARTAAALRCLLVVVLLLF